LLNLRCGAARCWALLLVRIYECLPLRYAKCDEPMHIIVFVLDQSIATADWPKMEQTAGQGAGRLTFGAPKRDTRRVFGAGSGQRRGEWWVDFVFH
jgi:hypothetical protein